MNDTVVTTPLNQSTMKLPYSRPNSRIGHPRRARSQYPSRSVDPRPSLTVAYRTAMTVAATTSTDGSQPQQPHAAIQPTLQQRFDFAFSLYSTRAREELHEFRALCAAIAHGAHEEKRQWQALCARVMQERDAYKAKLQEVVAGQQGRQPGSSTPSTDTAGPLKQESPEPTFHSPRGVKRSAEADSLASEDAGSISLNPRSRPGSPHSVDTPPHTSYSPPPVTPAQLSPNHTIPPPMHSPSLSEGGSSRGSPSPSYTTHSDNGCDHTAKRRKSSFDSCDLPASLETANAKRTPAPPLSGDFTHVDLMYNRQMNGSLVCRACLFESEKSDIYLPPTTFPARASWDALRHHCVYAHPVECADVAKLHPAEIFHLRQRMNAF
ncbi:hypothetical protein D9619_012791 [Psilocybe cf. subviscida]|uniref:Uncharacterized protein n=1 Tax=Psilocybe cf. subviscida TaxID=2480587 RepID=A0A8H5AR50_9AGAR|nr:hypothetical protein D9619_012791 [Psilocybe cf. subviscida]